MLCYPQKATNNIFFKKFLDFCNLARNGDLLVQLAHMQIHPKDEDTAFNSTSALLQCFVIIVKMGCYCGSMKKILLEKIAPLDATNYSAA